MTPSARIEHVNITTSDGPRMTALLKDLFGWSVRWEGPSLNGGHSIHVGGTNDYIALYTPRGGTASGFDKGLPLNHVGVEVEDLDKVECGVIAAGLKPFNHGDYEPGRRFYFFDWDGTEWEVISYA